MAINHKQMVIESWIPTTKTSNINGVEVIIPPKSLFYQVTLCVFSDTVKLTLPIS
jgi:hypothetical protein